MAGRSPIFDGVSPALLNTIQRVGNSYGPYGVRVTSAYRPGSGRSQHGRGKALDVELFDKATGKALPNYQNSKHAGDYQAFANAVYADAQKNDPALAQKLRWGGYFGNDAATGKPKYGSLDLMHFDEAGHIGMRGGSWKDGFTPEMRKQWGLDGATGGVTMAANAPRPPAAIPASTAAAAPAGPRKGDPRGMEAHIRATAAKNGIDPEVAVRVAKSEGLTSFQSNIVKNGQREPSYGAYQLYMGGGLGNQFQKDTGLDPRDPKNEQATIDYALKHAAKNGWGSWNGAKRVGIGPRDGIGTGTGGTQVASVGDKAFKLPSSIDTSAAAPSFTDTGGAGVTGNDASVIAAPSYSDTGGSAVTPGASPADDNGVATASVETPATKKKIDWGEGFGDIFKGFAEMASSGPAAKNAATPSGPTTVPAATLPTPGPVAPIVDPKVADMQRQQLAMALQRLNSRRLA